MGDKQEIIDQLLIKTDCKNDNQLAVYLSKKYSTTITRQTLWQFRNSSAVTITHILLEEALDNFLV